MWPRMALKPVRTNTATKLTIGAENERMRLKRKYLFQIVPESSIAILLEARSKELRM